MQVRKQQLELDMEQQTGSKSGKEYVNAVYCHPAFLSYMQNTSWEMPDWMTHKLESRLPEEILYDLRYTDDTTLMAESKEELRSFLMKVKQESAKAGLKLNTLKTKNMASGPITSWQIDGEPMERVTDFIFLGSKITIDGDFSHEIKRCLLLWTKAMYNLDSMLKTETSLCRQSPSSQSYGFPVVMYGCESWTIKKAEGWRIDDLEKNWCWRRILRAPWTARRWNQSILKEISPEHSLEGLMLKLKLGYSGHLMR